MVVLYISVLDKKCFFRLKRKKHLITKLDSYTGSGF